MKNTRLITIGYAKQLFVEGSREQKRMQKYAKHFVSLDVVVFTLKKDNLSETVMLGNLTLYPTNTKTRIGALVKAYKIGKRIASRHNTESYIVSTQDPLEPGWVAWALSLRKHVSLHVQIHGDYFNDIWRNGSLVNSIRQRLTLSLIKRARAIRTVSLRIKQSLVERGIKAEKIVVLPIRPELESFLESRSESTNTSDIFTYLYVGRLSPEKNIERIIRAFALLKQEKKNIQLKIVGSGVKESELKKLVADLKLEGDVLFETWTQDVPTEMQSADVFVFASRHESYGLVLVEAMAAGLPIITTDVGCVGDIMQDKVHGIVVSQDGDEEYRDAMKMMYNDTDARVTFGLQGRKKAGNLSEQTDEKYIEEWVNTILKTLD